MKWMLPLTVLCFPLAAFAAPWGVVGDYDLPRAPEGMSRIAGLGQPVSPTPGERYLLKPVLEGKSIKIFLDSGEESEETLAQYREKIKEAYNNWFLNAAKEIRKSGRTQEFADILPVLDKGIPLEFVPSGEDIIVEFVDRREVARLCGAQAAACYIFEGPKIYVPKNPRGTRSFLNPFGISSGKNLFRSLLHEIGHSLGFSDQYAQARLNTHPIYHGDKTNSTIMNKAVGLTCDDADGMINLIDLTRRKRRGGRVGWRSLCRSSKTYYIGGMALGNGPYMMWPGANGNVWYLREYRADRMQERELTMAWGKGISLFEPFAEHIVERDAIGRPVLAQGPHGEKVYYSYLYGRMMRFVTAGDKILLFENRERNLPNEKSFDKIIIAFTHNGKSAMLEADRRSSYGSLSYKEDGNALTVNLTFKKGKVEHLSGNGGKAAVPCGMALSMAAAPGAASMQAQVKNQVVQKEREELERKLTEWYLGL